MQGGVWMRFCLFASNGSNPRLASSSALRQFAKSRTQQDDFLKSWHVQLFREATPARSLKVHRFAVANQQSELAERHAAEPVLIAADSPDSLNLQGAEDGIQVLGRGRRKGRLRLSRASRSRAEQEEVPEFVVVSEPSSADVTDVESRDQGGTADGSSNGAVRELAQPGWSEVEEEEDDLEDEASIESEPAHGAIDVATPPSTSTSGQGARCPFEAMGVDDRVTVSPAWRCHVPLKHQETQGHVMVTVAVDQ